MAGCHLPKATGSEQFLQNIDWFYVHPGGIYHFTIIFLSFGASLLASQQIQFLLVDKSSTSWRSHLLRPFDNYDNYRCVQSYKWGHFQRLWTLSHTARQFSLLTRFPSSAFHRSDADFVDHLALSYWLAFPLYSVVLEFWAQLNCINIMDAIGDSNAGINTFLMSLFLCISNK